MTIFIHYVGNRMPTMPETAAFLGKITILHMTKSEDQYWYSDDHENDQAGFDAEKKRAEEYSKTTMPSIWM